MGERTLTWLHLSDLHRCSTRDGGGGTIVLDALLEDLQRLREEQGLAPDLLFFTGDAAFGRLPTQDLESQFLEAWEWLEKVRELWGLSAERVFLVPGNHDVDRSQVHRKEQDWLEGLATQYGAAAVNDLLQKGGKPWADYFCRLVPFRDFLQQAYPHQVQDEKRLIFAQTLEIEGLRVGIAGFNSAWSCGAAGEKAKLWLGAEFQLGEVLPKLADCDLKIALIHHPPNWLVEAEDAGPFRIRLQKHFHVLLHGHEHSMWAETPQAQHLKIAAGATHDRGGTAPFGYNLVRWRLPEPGAVASGELWLRHFDLRVDEWGPDSIPRYTDERGVWALAWPGNVAAALPDSEEPTVVETRGEAAVAEAPEWQPSAAEKIGVFGREADLDKARKKLESKRFLWLHGLSGIGKSKLVDALASSLEWEIRQLRFRGEMTFEEVYAALAPELGCREPSPKPFGVMGIVDFKPFTEWGSQLSRRRLVHLEGGDGLISHPERKKILEMLVEAVNRVPLLALVVESQQKPGDSPDFVTQSLKGLEADCLAAYFRRPLPSRPEVGWELSSDELTQVAGQVAGDKAKRKDLHPLALFLLVQVAAELGSRPPQIFEKYPERFRKELKKGLFDILYEQVLSVFEQHMLRLCALYRKGVLIPDRHLERLGARVGEMAAFGGLVRRAILELSGESYRLHDLLSELTLGQAAAKEGKLDDHQALAEAWLESLRFRQRADLPDLVLPANEAFYHLDQAENFLELAKLEGKFLRIDIVPRLDERSSRLLAAKRWGETRAVLELWARVEPQNSKPFRFLGELLSKIEGKASESALLSLERAIELSPDMPHNWSGYGRCLQARRQPEVFLARFAALTAEVQSRLLRDSYVNDIHGQLLASRGGQAGAEVAAERKRLIDAGSRNPADYNNQAKWLLSQKKPDEALALLDLARQRGVEDAYSLALRDDVLTALGRGEEAAADRERRIAAGSRGPADYNNQAKWLLSQKKPAEALVVLDLARQRGVEDAYILALRDDVLTDLGRGEEAAADRERRIDAGSRHPADYNNQAKWLHSQKKPDEALALLDLARQRGLEDEYILTLRAKFEQQAK